MSNRPKVIKPSDEEDAAIKRGIAADSDTFEVPREDFKKLKRLGARGHPKLESPKILVSIRYDAEVIDAFKATGDGWQTRINDALKDWLKDHQPA